MNAQDLLKRYAKGERDFIGANFSGADLSGADLSGANLRGAYLIGANFIGANLRGANLRGANLRGADLGGADLGGAKWDIIPLAAVRVFSGLYNYECWAAVAEDGTTYVRMGCLWKSLDEWNRIGIRNINPDEFPGDGSEKCERRVRAFEFTKAEALIMARAIKPQGVKRDARGRFAKES